MCMTGIRASIEKEGMYTAKTQEAYGEIEARKLLKELCFSQDDVDRICLIISRHHTYDADIDGLDFRILLEADACVNMYDRGSSEETIMTMYRTVIRTEAGKKIYKTMFDLTVDF